jgi:hypothetical protein
MRSSSLKVYWSSSLHKFGREVVERRVGEEAEGVESREEGVEDKVGEMVEVARVSLLGISLVGLQMYRNMAMNSEVWWEGKGHE